MSDAPQYNIDQIRQRIGELAALPEIELPKAMDNLQKALRSQPDLLALLMPEDTGAMVAELIRLRNEQQAALNLDSKGSKKKAAGAKKSSAKSDKAALDSIGGVQGLLDELADL